ncbi:SDR family oxidoreductase [Streptomyces olivoreticuli]
MQVFMTGASGWIGSAAVDELLGAGHKVDGLARSDAAAASLEAKNVTVIRGDLGDLDALRRGAREADAVVHLANSHDRENPAAANAMERTATETLAEALVGTDRPFVLASVFGGVAQGGSPSTESDPSPFVGLDSPRGGSENLALEYAQRGVRTIVARFAPTVHGVGDHMFMALIAAAARRHGLSAYVGDGSTSWSAVHISDAARLVRLGLERAPAGSRLHAVAEEAISTRAIAEVVGRALGVPVGSVAPENAIEHFGFVGSILGRNQIASSTVTRELLGWTPSGPGLIEDLASPGYFTV